MTFKNPRNVISRNVLVAQMLKERTLTLYNAKHEHFATIVMPPHVHPLSMLGVAASDGTKAFIMGVCEKMQRHPNKVRSAFMGVFHMRMAEDMKTVTTWSPTFLSQNEDGKINHTITMETTYLGDEWVEDTREHFRHRLTHQYLPKEEADKIQALQEKARTRKRKRV